MQHSNCVLNDRAHFFPGLITLQCFIHSFLPVLLFALWVAICARKLTLKNRECARSSTLLRLWLLQLVIFGFFGELSYLLYIYRSVASELWHWKFQNLKWMLSYCLNLLVSKNTQFILSGTAIFLISYE